MKTATLATTNHGTVTVRLEHDRCGNRRLVPVDPAPATLAEWRANPASTVPPWILPSDCTPPSEWGRAMSVLIDLDRAHAVADHSRDFAAGGAW
jgi:hypothetical protein